MDKNKWYRIGLYEKAIIKTISLEEKLRITKEIGFDYLEMSIDETDEKINRLDWDSEKILNLHKVMLKNNIFINSICLSANRKYPIGSHDINIRSKGVQIIEKAIILAYKLGVRVIQLAGYDVYYEVSDENTKKYFLDNLKKITDIANKYGVILAFETMENEFMDTIKKSIRFIDKMNSPFLQVYPDIGNLSNALRLYGGALDKDLDYAKGHIVAVHLKDTKQGVYRDLLLGEGDVDFSEAIYLLKNRNCRIFTLEFWDLGKDNWRENIEKSYEYVINIIDNIKEK